MSSISRNRCETYFSLERAFTISSSYDHVPIKCYNLTNVAVKVPNNAIKFTKVNSQTLEHSEITPWSAFLVAKCPKSWNLLTILAFFDQVHWKCHLRLPQRKRLLLLNWWQTFNFLRIFLNQEPSQKHDTRWCQDFEIVLTHQISLLMPFYAMTIE